MSAKGIGTAFWDIVRLPLQIATIGLALLFLLKIAELAGFPSLAAFPVTGDGSRVLIGFLLFFVGLGFAIFLWWLSARYFTLLSDPKVTEKQIEGLKELPLALPEGTIRALLALIVGVVGLPLLLFQKTLGLDDAIAGYVNGIITGVFGFYFGSRTSAADAQAAKQTAQQATRTLETVQQEKKELKDEKAQLQQEKETLKESVGTVAADATRPTRLSQTVDKLDRHLALAEQIITVFGPVLPKGTVPSGVSDTIKQARAVADAARGIADGKITEDDVKKAADAATAIIGKSPLLALVERAAGALPALGGAAGPLGAVALVLGVGWQLGSAEYRRWRARILAAPYEPNLIQIGNITPTSARACLASSPIFSKAFASIQGDPGFFATLLDAVQRDDAADRLWVMFGSDPNIFESRDEMERGLDEYRRALLADQAASDVTPETLTTVTQGLEAADPSLHVGAPSVSAVNQIIDGGALATGASEEQKAALEALVMLVGVMREKNIDPVQLLAELKS